MPGYEDLVEYEEVRARLRDKYIEPMDDETIELLREELFTTLGKVNRLCNLLIMRPKGLAEGCIDAIQDVKCNMSRIKWYLEQRDTPIISKNLDDIRLLAEAHRGHFGAEGEAADRLLKVLPLGSQT